MRPPNHAYKRVTPFPYRPRPRGFERLWRALEGMVWVAIAALAFLCMGLGLAVLWELVTA